jgi:hypothetical protein
MGKEELEKKGIKGRRLDMKAGAYLGGGCALWPDHGFWRINITFFSEFLPSQFNDVTTLRRRKTDYSIELVLVAVVELLERIPRINWPTVHP